MSGGSIYRCPACGRLVIYGQTCTCGEKTNRPTDSGRDGTAT